ncbi:MAG TPA: AmmeMemoRadiSam system protein A [Anaerolineales bacterium]|nr:AmmeMemoRadiSam system protein A [Anaerolineales bacterium]
MDDKLSPEEQQTLLRLARDAMTRGVKGERMPPLADSSFSLRLREQGASFVTLTVDGELRGCIGALEPYQSLAEDVCEHAVAAALEDPRFPPVTVDELNGIRIEVSRLTRPTALVYKDAEDLLSKLRPHVDGVVLRDAHGRRATFLPQVWKTIHHPADFLTNLCYKMGASESAWRTKHLDVFIYQVEEFHESPNNPVA